MSKSAYRQSIESHITLMRENHVSDDTIQALLTTTQQQIQDNTQTLAQCLQSFTQTAYTLAAIHEGITYQQTSGNLTIKMNKVIDDQPHGAPPYQLHEAVKTGLKSAILGKKLLSNAEHIHRENNLINNLERIYKDVQAKDPSELIPTRAMLAMHISEMVMVQPEEERDAFSAKVKTILNIDEEVSLTSTQSKMIVENALITRYRGESDKLEALFQEMDGLSKSNSKKTSYLDQYGTLEYSREYKATVKRLLDSNDLTRQILSPEQVFSQEKRTDFLRLCEYNSDAQNLIDILKSTSPGSGANIMSRLKGASEGDSTRQQQYLRNIDALQHYVNNTPISAEEEEKNNNARLLAMLRVCVSRGDNGIESEDCTAQSRQYDITKTNFASHGLMGGITFTSAQLQFLQDLESSATVNNGVDLLSRTTLEKNIETNARAVRNSINTGHHQIIEQEISKQIAELPADSRESDDDATISAPLLQNWLTRNSRAYDTRLVELASTKKSLGTFSAKLLHTSPQKNVLDAFNEQSIQLEATMAGKIRATTTTATSQQSVV